MITLNRLREVLHYDPETGDFTRKKTGLKAGSINGHGYAQIGVDGRNYQAHRLAWLYVYGTFPKVNLDHRDGNKLNNKLSNLREATSSENNQNQRKKRNNTSGVKCVHWLKRRMKWQVRICRGGVRKHIGEFNSISEAIEAYNRAVIEIHGEYANLGGQS